MLYFPFILLLPLVTTGQRSTTLRGHSCRAKVLKICPMLRRGGEGWRAGQCGKSRMESPSVLGARWQGHSPAPAAHGANTRHVAVEPQGSTKQICSGGTGPGTAASKLIKFFPASGVVFFRSGGTGMWLGHQSPSPFPWLVGPRPSGLWFFMLEGNVFA